MDCTKNGDPDRHSDVGLPRSDSRNPPEGRDEGNLDEDVISLYAHSDYELESEDFSDKIVKRHSSHLHEAEIENSADEESLRRSDSNYLDEDLRSSAIEFGFSKRRGASFNRQFAGFRSGGRRRSRGRKKWSKRTGGPDGFGHNSTRNPPGQSSRGNRVFLGRPYFGKYSNSNFAANPHTRKRGILGDAPSRHFPVSQFTSKSCPINTNLRGFNQPIGMQDMIIKDKRQVIISNQRLWHQTSVSTDDDDVEWFHDPQNENVNRQRRTYRENLYQRRILNRYRNRHSIDGMPMNRNNNEMSEEGRESPKLGNVNELDIPVSCVLANDIDSSDARHVVLDPDTNSTSTSNKESDSSDPSFLQSKLSLFRLGEGEPRQATSSTRSSLLPTPESSAISEYAPPAKKRAALLPTPNKAEVEVAANVVGRVSHEQRPVSELMSGTSPPVTRSKVLSPVRRTPEKTATVAPLQKASSTLTDITEVAESRQLVTPPIEVSHIVDAPPRPPNPGPTFAISSNSNSPAASRPSSRSGRFVGFEPGRAATPDVPPRPSNPPPPVCAPSPASTPEGMPPRPQNPGPPLDVSLSTMAARSVPSTNATTFHVVPVSCTGGLLPLPAHSKLPTAGHHATPGVEPSPAHSSVSRMGMLQSSVSNMSTATSLCVTNSVSSPLASDVPMKSLLPLPVKESVKQSDRASEEKHLMISGYDSSIALSGRGSAQAAVIDLSKSTSIQVDPAPIEDAANVHDQSAGRKEVKGILPTPESLISRSQPRMTSACASLSFTTTVVSSSYPISSYLSTTSAKSSQSSKVTLLPSPEDKSTALNSSETTEPATEGSKSPPKTFHASETTLKDRIISCLREKQYGEGLLALKEAMTKMPEKFGDGEVYEVIEFFGQNDAYEQVVAAARLVRTPDERLLQFLEHIAEQVPDDFKDKKDDIWLIYSEVLNKNANITVINSCIKCFAALECWNTVWTTLQLYPNSVSLPSPTVALCLKPLASGAADKHLRSGVVFLNSLSMSTKRSLDIDVMNAVWLRCAELGMADAVSELNHILKVIPQPAEAVVRQSGRIRAFLMENLVAGRVETLSQFVVSVGQHPCQQYLDFFVAGFMVSEEPIPKVLNFMKQLRLTSGRAAGPRSLDAFCASLCVRFMRHLSHRQAWGDAFDLWRLVGELGIACERSAALEGENQTSIALLALEVSVRHGRYDTAVSMLSESLVLGQPWTDAELVRRRVYLLQEIFERSFEASIDFAASAFKALLSTKDTDQAIIHDYGRIIDLMTVYNDYLVAACHQESLDSLTIALDLVSIAHQKQLLVKPTVLRYLVVACVRFKLHTKVKEFLQRGMTVSIYPTIDVHSNMLLLPTDLATEEIAALLLLYLMLLKEYLVQALNASRVGGDQSSCAVDVLQACSITVVPNNVNLRDREFTERFQLDSTEYGLLQRVQGILASCGNASSASGSHAAVRTIDYLKSPISADLTFEGGRSVLKLNTSEVYNNVYYIDPPSE